MDRARLEFYRQHGKQGKPPWAPEFDDPKSRDPGRFEKSRVPFSRKMGRQKGRGFYGLDRAKSASVLLWRAHVTVKDDPSAPTDSTNKSTKYKARYLKLGGKKPLLVAAVARDLEARYRGLRRAVKFNFSDVLLCVMMSCADPSDPLPIPEAIFHMFRDGLPSEQVVTMHPKCACAPALPVFDHLLGSRPSEVKVSSNDPGFRFPPLARAAVRKLLTEEERGRVLVSAGAEHEMHRPLGGRQTGDQGLKSRDVRGPRHSLGGGRRKDERASDYVSVSDLRTIDGSGLDVGMSHAAHMSGSARHTGAFGSSSLQFGQSAEAFRPEAAASSSMKLVDAYLDQKPGVLPSLPYADDSRYYQKADPDGSLGDNDSEGRNSAFSV